MLCVLLLRFPFFLHFSTFLSSQSQFCAHPATFFFFFTMLLHARRQSLRVRNLPAESVLPRTQGSFHFYPCYKPYVTKEGKVLIRAMFSKEGKVLTRAMSSRENQETIFRNVYLEPITTTAEGWVAATYEARLQNEYLSDTAGPVARQTLPDTPSLDQFRWLSKASSSSSSSSSSSALPTASSSSSSASLPAASSSSSSSSLPAASSSSSSSSSLPAASSSSSSSASPPTASSSSHSGKRSTASQYTTPPFKKKRRRIGKSTSLYPQDPPSRPAAPVHPRVTRRPPPLFLSTSTQPQPWLPPPHFLSTSTAQSSLQERLSPQPWP